jgi:hypothetical protein
MDRCPQCKRRFGAGIGFASRRRCLQGHFDIGTGLYFIVGNRTRAYPAFPLIILIMLLHY